VSRRRSLVTGGSGFFGTVLVEQLVARGDEVSILDVAAPETVPDGVEVIQVDIRDAAAVRSACDGVDLVFHNVAQVPLAQDPELFWTVNVVGTANLLVGARDAGASKVVATSTSAVYGVPESNPVDERTPAAPLEAYGRAKLEAELLCRDASDAGLDVTIVRPRTILGHGRLGIMSMLFELVAEGAPVPVLGSGDNVYQFVHADDLAEACILAGNRAGSEDFNCGAAEFGTMRQVLEHLCAHAGTGSEVRSVPMRAAVLGMNVTSRLGLSPLGAYHSLMYGRSMYFDIGKAQDLLGWQPAYSNEQMFVDSYEWYLEHRGEVLAATNQSHHRSAVKQGILAAVKRVL
jgi:nucleoside-diphosphate-sugar epimerase